jgi:hypothetical protein
MQMKIFALMIGGILLAANARAQELTLESYPPVVIKTVPEAGTSEVDASITEIRVTFSKAMQDGSWSWAMASQQSFPEMAGKPRYDDARTTCVMPVKLQLGRTYAIWINTPKLLNFKDAKGQPAVPYLLVFKTKG